MALQLWWLRGMIIILSFLCKLPSISMNHGPWDEKNLDVSNTLTSYESNLQDLYKNCSRMGAFLAVVINEETLYDDQCRYECLTIDKVIQKHTGKNISLHMESSKETCSLALKDLQNEICYKKEEAVPKPAKIDVWLYGFAAVSVINICPLLGFFMFPFMGKKFFRHLLTTLTGLAASSLMGSAIFHMLPQAYGLFENGDGNEYLNQSVFVGLGIWVFLILEGILKIIDDFWKRRQVKKMLTTEYMEALSTVTSPVDAAQSLNEIQNSSLEDDEGVEEGKIPENSNTVDDCSYHNEVNSQMIHANGQNHPEVRKQKKGVETIVWMITFSDSLHNLIDGLTIGAAFSKNLLTGCSITLGVLCEEFPHELGDYAILMKSGLTKTEAAAYNFIAAVSCYLGMALGVVFGEFQSQAIFGFAGGMFIYISLVDMVGEVNKTIKNDSKISVARALHTLLLQNIGMAVGGISLYLLAVYHDSLKFD